MEKLPESVWHRTFQLIGSEQRQMPFWGLSLSITLTNYIQFKLGPVRHNNHITDISVHFFLRLQALDVNNFTSYLN